MKDDTSKERILKAFAKTDSINEKEQSLVAVASTNGIDRDGEIIEAKAFENALSLFRKNPVVLWAHDHSKPPIAKSLQEKITDDGLIFQPQFAKTTFAKEIWSLFKNGFLNAFSIGFIPKEYEYEEINGKKVRKFTEVELLEISAVPVPSNAAALAVRSVTGSSELQKISQADFITALIEYDKWHLKQRKETQIAELKRLTNISKELLAKIKSIGGE